MKLNDRQRLGIKIIVFALFFGFIAFALIHIAHSFIHGHARYCSDHEMYIYGNDFPGYYSCHNSTHICRGNFESDFICEQKDEIDPYVGMK